MGGFFRALGGYALVFKAIPPVAAVRAVRGGITIHKVVLAVMVGQQITRGRMQRRAVLVEGEAGAHREERQLGHLRHPPEPEAGLCS